MLLAKISITCFAASYAVALALELTRLVFRSGVRGAVMLGFAGAGVVAQTLFLAWRAISVSSGAAPLSSQFDWYLLASLALALTYLYLTVYHPKTAFGVFLLPLVLGLVAFATFTADREPFPQPQAIQVWGAIHGVFLLLGTVAVLLGFVAGLMCLVQTYRLKHKLEAPRGLKLPSLEWLERNNHRALIVSVLMFGLGFLSGIVLNLVNRRFDAATLPWTDPIVWSYGLLLGWMVVVTAFSLFYRPARQGRKVAYLTVASFVFLALVVVLRVLMPSQHGRTATGPTELRLSLARTRHADERIVAAGDLPRAGGRP